jgi:hypothetical protein
MTNIMADGFFTSLNSIPVIINQGMSLWQN